VKRRLFNLASAVSLVLCVASIVAWVSAHERPVFFSTGGVRFNAQYGRLWVHWETPYQPVPSASRSRFLHRGRFAFVVFVETDNVVHGASGAAVRNVTSDLYVPLWELGAVFLTMPAVWTIRRSFARRGRLLGLCANCGYDLRGTPERCPECGTPASQVEPQPAEGAAA
jgi:hypothetical protein